jgi:hypothetical protein
MSIVNGMIVAASKMRPNTARVVVTFAPSIRLSHSVAAEAEHAAVHGQAWQDLRARFSGIMLRPVFTSLDAAALQQIEARAVRAGIVPRLTSYFAIVVPQGTDPVGVADAVTEWPHVECAYVEGGPVPPPVKPADDPLSANQGYLSPAPTGIDAHFAWTQADGYGIGFVDLEQGWTLDHEDLPPSIPKIGPGSFLQDPAWLAHGTAVLGIVAAVDNDRGGIGIAPEATVRVVSQWFDTPDGQYFSTANAIALAIAQMQAGDVLLVETTAPPVSKFGWVPAEVDPLVFDLIKTATSIGITVLEPAGNNLQKPDTPEVGGSNLDDFTDKDGRAVLNRGSPDFRDSGAIMVGAGSSTFPHKRLDYSNFGSRVDCYAWGENIATCGGFPFTAIGTSPQTAYMLNFAGTSGATAIVAGAAVLLQSWAVKHLGNLLDTSTVRAVLSDASLNTPSKTPVHDQIGVMPDLRRIIVQLSLNRIRSRWDAIIAILFGGVAYGGGGWVWIPGEGLKPVPPRGDRELLSSLSADKRDVLVGLALLELAGLVSDPANRKSIEQSSAALMRAAAERIAVDIEER